MCARLARVLVAQVLPEGEEAEGGGPVPAAWRDGEGGRGRGGVGTWGNGEGGGGTGRTAQMVTLQRDGCQSPGLKRPKGKMGNSDQRSEKKPWKRGQQR